MKVLKTIGLSLLGLIVVLLIIGFFLPSTTHVERSMIIKASPPLVFEQVNVLKNWEKWSPWREMDPEMKVTYGEQASGMGAWYSWTGPKSGEGKLTLTSVKPYSQIMSDLDFGEMGIAKCDYLFEPAEGGTKMTWIFDSELGGNPVSRWMGILMKGMLESQFDAGMNKINSYAGELKEMPAASGRIESVEVKDMPEVNYMFVHDTASLATIGPKLGEGFGKIGEAAGMQDIAINGAPFAIYYSESTTNFDMDVCMPLERAGKDAGIVKSAKIPAGKAVVVDYYGAYELTGNAHEAAAKYLSEHPELTMTGAPREEYVTDPETEKNPDNVLTRVIYPVK
ncbi:MAG: SRPBCC family protein [Bacteroidia bacterium]